MIYPTSYPKCPVKNDSAQPEERTEERTEKRTEKRTERSDRLPFGYEVRLMKICETCTKAELDIERVNYYAENHIVNIAGIIKCKNERVCKNIIQMCEGDA